MSYGLSMMQSFLNKYHQQAVDATRGTTLLPETMLSQASVESNWGASDLSAKYNNFFGIKKYPAYRGSTVKMPTKEYLGGRWVAVQADFCWWPSVTEGFRGWVHFLQQNPRYAKVFQQNTAEAQIRELKAAGYATDPNYISTITQRLGYLRQWLPGFPLLSEASKAVALNVVAQKKNAVSNSGSNNPFGWMFGFLFGK